MAEAIVSFVLKQLGSVPSEQASGYITKQVSLVGDVDEEVEKLTHNLEAIQAVLFDAEQKQMKTAAVRLWLHRLKDVCYDVEDVLDEWNTAILKLRIEGGHDHNAIAPKKKVCCFFPFRCFGFKEVVLRRDIAIRITDINKKLDPIAKEKNDYNLNVIKAIERFDNQQMQTTSFIDVSDIIGRENLKNDLVNKLLCEDREKNLHIISLVGMGGIGKTTLAQFAYNNNKVENNFDKRIWVCVSEPFDEIRIAKAIIQSLENYTSNVVELEYLLHCIRDSVKTKKFLLILDDVWTENDKKWEPFYNCLKNGLHESKILITTRKESVARIMKSNDIINVGELSNEENWLFFEKLALSERLPEEYKNLEEIGRKIVRKCKGLPLAVKTIGSLLQFKKSKEQWQHVLDSEMWKFEDTEKGLLTPLMLSYNDLPPMGYLREEKDDENEDIIGEEYFDYLVARSLLQKHKSFSGSYMHDIVHDFAQFLGDKECLSIEVYGDEDPLKNSPKDRGIGKLVNLRRLEYNDFRGTLLYTPKGVEKLTGLRRLGSFVIRGGGDHDNKACSFEGLKNLNRLEGGLIVRGLGNVTDVSNGKLAEVFKNKEKLRWLDLKFDKRGEVERLDEDDELILETSQPPPNLETLSIYYYKGNTFPAAWTTLTKLKELRLKDCPKLKALPDSLLQRTTLQELSISGCPFLCERYNKETGEDWPKISHIPYISINLQFVRSGQ
ncbi:putative disease resistance protein RGA3 [Mangifera indica]|uniref:putative disease resistance protein RGA3 n=1 Tax=Mangifera indica TaxID=29780 RepID=UPI001CF97A0D|nr:putative disease resistance protein RGA3 [Mangifera indica]